MRNKMNTVKALFAATSLMVGSVALAVDPAVNTPTPAGANANQGKPMVPATPGTDNMNTVQNGSAGMNAADGVVAAQLASIATAGKQAPDRMFILNAGCGNMWEASLSRVVLDRSQDDKVKEVATMVMNDHMAANENLKAVARSNDVKLPDGLTSMKEAELNVFKSIPVDELEKCYLGMLKADHAKDIISYSIHEKSTNNDALKTYISQTLPKLREHAQHISQVAAEKGVIADKPMGDMSDMHKEMK